MSRQLSTEAEFFEVEQYLLKPLSNITQNPHSADNLGDGPMGLIRRREFNLFRSNSNSSLTSSDFDRDLSPSLNQRSCMDLHLINNDQESRSVAFENLKPNPFLQFH